jgi:hypothetical protein
MSAFKYVTILWFYPYYTFYIKPISPTPYTKIPSGLLLNTIAA